MVDRIGGYDSFAFVEVVSSSIEVAVKSWEIGTAHFDADLMAFFKVITRAHRGHFDLIDFSFFHHHFFVVPFSIPYSLDSFVEIVSLSVRIYIDQLDGDIGIFGI